MKPKAVKRAAKSPTNLSRSDFDSPHDVTATHYLYTPKHNKYVPQSRLPVFLLGVSLEYGSFLEYLHLHPECCVESSENEDNRPMEIQRWVSLYALTVARRGNTIYCGYQPSYKLLSFKPHDYNPSSFPTRSTSDTANIKMKYESLHGGLGVLMMERLDRLRAGIPLVDVSLLSRIQQEVVHQIRNGKCVNNETQAISTVVPPDYYILWDVDYLHQPDNNPAGQE